MFIPSYDKLNERLETHNSGDSIHAEKYRSLNTSF